MPMPVRADFERTMEFAVEWCVLMPHYIRILETEKYEPAKERVRAELLTLAAMVDSMLKAQRTAK